LTRTLPLVLALLASVVIAPVGSAAALDGPSVDRPALAAGAPKVALIVGPAGEATSGYRALADEAAAVAAAHTPNVVRVYSPDATWPAVRAALEGASIVVYMGHGNGWPSRYRDALYPPTQNGFGLNPVAGGDDDTHQYFGEQFLDDVRLAPNAVVLLHRLCYASGNTEPGLPEGTLGEAVQRVDNYAAGFLRAGAGAVVAEAHLGPAFYVRELLAGATASDAWSRSPHARGNLQVFASSRTPGAGIRIDPDAPTGGYHRSLVLRENAAPEAVRADGGGSPLPIVPSLVRSGVEFAPPRLAGPPIAGTATDLLLPVRDDGMARVPRGIMASVAWTRLDTPAGVVAGAADSSPVVAPPIASVVPERPAAVVEPVEARRGRGRLVIATTIPREPGRYRMTTRLHDAAGIAFDAATQGLIAALHVEVAAPLSARFGVQELVHAAPGAAVDLVVRVRNTGSAAWPTRPGTWQLATGEDPEPVVEQAIPARLIATWVSTARGEVPPPVTVVLPIDDTVPGGEAVATLRLVAPERPGAYLVLLDVQSPEHGSLAAAGSDPGLVRVAVSGP